ncbi:StbA [Klebsiella pneumoniae]|nr:StbA [Klebsiella pneumoniae]MCB7487701.1 StbA [Klebsiella pneumoniae]
MNKTKGCLIANFATVPNTQPSEPEAQESEKAESPGIIDKEFFNKIGENFDPKKFNKKF